MRSDTPFFGSNFGICVVRPSEDDKKWVPAISGNLMVKCKLPPQSGSSLDEVEPHPWKRAISIFFIKRNIWGSGWLIYDWEINIA